MDGDSFSDPRRRSSRSRGRSRGRGRGRGAPPGRGRGTTVKRAQPHPKDIGTNDFRFNESEEAGDADVKEDEFDAGVDFEDAARQSMADAPRTEVGDGLAGLMVKDLSGLEKALLELPLWMRLGDGCRFALGVPDDETVQNYLEPFQDIKESTSADKNVGAKLAAELSGLPFDEDMHETSTEVQNLSVKDSTSLVSTSGGKAIDARSNRLEEHLTEEKDDFDKWLDDV